MAHRKSTRLSLIKNVGGTYEFFSQTIRDKTTMVVNESVHVSQIYYEGNSVLKRNQLKGKDSSDL